jgi:hypothetical protein
MSVQKHSVLDLLEGPLSAMSGHWSNRIFRTHLPIPNVCFRLEADGQALTESRS